MSLPWPGPRAARREFLAFGIAPIVFDPTERPEVLFAAMKTGSVCGVHEGGTLLLPSDACYYTQVLHELAHAAVWFVGGCEGDYQWGLTDPTDLVAETDVAAVHLALLHRRRSILHDPRGLLDYFRRVGIPLGDYDEARRDGAEIWRAAVAMAKGTRLEKNR